MDTLLELALQLYSTYSLQETGGLQGSVPSPAYVHYQL